MMYFILGKQENRKIGKQENYFRKVLNLIKVEEGFDTRLKYELATVIQILTRSNSILEKLLRSSEMIHREMIHSEMIDIYSELMKNVDSNCQAHNTNISKIS